jgi:hypothetical protein
VVFLNTYSEFSLFLRLRDALNNQCYDANKLVKFHNKDKKIHNILQSSFNQNQNAVKTKHLFQRFTVTCTNVYPN